MTTRKLNRDELEYMYRILLDTRPKDVIDELATLLQAEVTAQEMRKEWIEQFAEAADEEANDEMDRVATAGINQVMQENSSDDDRR